MIRALIFDLDDTLYLEADYLRSGVNVLARSLAPLFAPGKPGVPVADCEVELWTAFATAPRRALDLVAQHWGRKLGIPEERLRQEMLDLYRGHRPNIEPCPDVLRVLPQLVQNFQLAILSDGDEERQQLKLEVLGISRFFREVMFTGARQEWQKPSPHGFKVLTERLGVRPEECCYVADNPRKDFQGPKLLAMTTVRIRRLRGLYRLAEATTGGEPDVTFSDLEPLPDTITRLGRHPALRPTGQEVPSANHEEPAADFELRILK